MVLYILCYDLHQPRNVQLAQIAYWLDFLNSSLPISDSISSEKCCIILVGLRADIRNSSSPQFTLEHLSSWKQQWSRLPLFTQLFFISAETSGVDMKGLFEVVVRECGRMFTSYTIQIPTKYKKTLEQIQQYSLSNDESIFTARALFNAHGFGMEESTFSLMLQYFHEIGKIALLKEGLVCTDIQHIAKIAAKFISPEDVQAHLINKWDEESGDIRILSLDNVGFLLGVPAHQAKRLAKYE